MSRISWPVLKWKSDGYIPTSEDVGGQGAWGTWLAAPPVDNSDIPRHLGKLKKPL